MPPIQSPGYACSVSQPYRRLYQSLTWAMPRPLVEGTAALMHILAPLPLARAAEDGPTSALNPSPEPLWGGPQLAPVALAVLFWRLHRCVSARDGTMISRGGLAGGRRPRRHRPYVPPLRLPAAIAIETARVLNGSLRARLQPLGQVCAIESRAQQQVPSLRVR
jgi:hypothetical protein